VLSACVGVERFKPTQTNLASEELANDLGKEARHGQAACGSGGLQQFVDDSCQKSVKTAA
jgi:hypothetical protein